MGSSLPPILHPTISVVADFFILSSRLAHAHFTGADEPYEKLKRALKAEVDEAAWSSLYSTTSRPFDPPQTGRIAVKVINHYGDEVLKVFPVPLMAAEM